MNAERETLKVNARPGFKIRDLRCLNIPIRFRVWRISHQRFLIGQFKQSEPRISTPSDAILTFTVDNEEPTGEHAKVRPRHQ